jgi:branched-chain amino acid transport system permease protein
MMPVDRATAPGRARTARNTARLPNDRWHAIEIAFWLLPVAAYFLFPGYLVLISQIMIVGLFAVSLDLILGYAGIVSLGHAAFFGLGAYTAGLLSVHGWSEPISGLLAAAAVAAAFGFVSSFLIVRGNDLARLMVTLGIGLMLFEAANKAAAITGGVDGLSGMVVGKIFGVFSLDLDGKTAYVYSLAVLFLLFVLLRRLVASPFGLALIGIREGGRRMPAIGVDVQWRLTLIFTVGAAVAGVAGALLAQTTQFVGLDALSFSRSAELLIILVLGGTGRLYGGLIGAAVFMLAQDKIAALNPAYWQFWIGLLLVVIVLFARGGVLGGLAVLRQRFKRAPAVNPGADPAASLPASPPVSPPVSPSATPPAAAGTER